MKLSIVFSSVVLAAVYLGACSSKSSGDGDEDTSKESTEPGTDDSAAAKDEDEDAPHAPGVITFGESHSADDSASLLSIAAAFSPTNQLETTTSKSCGYKATKIDGCTIAGGIEDYVAPKCSKACGSSAVCSYDANCKTKCVPLCTKECEYPDTCAFDTAGKQYCKTYSVPDAGPSDEDGPTIEDFNAGSISFSGETGAVTLRPPYTFDRTTAGVGFIPDTEVKVSATGASEVGFNAFKGSFNTTSMLETSLKKLTAKDLYGTGPVKVTWAKGADKLSLVLTNSGRSATCELDDSSGAFTITRKVLNALQPVDDGLSDKPVTVGSVNFTMTRMKSTTQKGIETTGKISGVTIEKEGWVNFISTSTESAVLTGCGYGEAWCGGECIDVKSDELNCGACGNECATGKLCSSGNCY